MTPSTENRPILKVLVLLGIAAGAFWLAAWFPDVVLTLIFAVLMAFVLKPLVVLFEFRLGMRRALSVIAVFLLLGAMTAVAGITLVPIAIDRLREMYAMFRNFPFEQRLQEAALNLTANIPFLEPAAVTAHVRTTVQGGQLLLSHSLSAIASFIINLIIIPIVAYFILAEGDFAAKRLIERVPNKYFEMTLNTINRIQKDLVGYLRGWILDSAIVAVLSVAGFYAVGVNYAILLGVLNGVSNLIPYVGPVFGVIPAILVSLAQFGDFHQAASILLVAAAIQLVDNTVIQPLCFAKTVDMHPVTVIVVLIVGNELMGVAGMLLAIPIATVFKAIAVETYWGLKNYRITS
jgi:predicted PurR-regulated permease PerM